MKNLIKLLPITLVHQFTLQQLKNYPTFRDFFLKQDPETIEALQEKYLLYMFHQCAERVPQYKAFLEQHNIRASHIQSVADFLRLVPETNKKNYIFSAKKMTDLCMDKDYHNIHMLVKSSGHSGKQCYWARSHTKDIFGETAMSIGLDENFNISKKKTLIINSFILGSWVTGITFNDFASAHCTVINIGPDPEEIFQTIDDVGHQFDQVLITGYPPFMKELVEYAQTIRFDWKKYQVGVIVGGEAFSESWRDYIQQKAHLTKVRSGFGASDIGILGGLETDDTVFIRRLADKNPKIKKALFGDVEGTPMLFQYPLDLFVYTNEKSELIFSTVLPETVQPVLNYNLEDMGGVLSYHEMQKRLRPFGIRREFALPLPFLFIVGRNTGPVKFHAFLIYPENIEDCMYKNKAIAHAVTANFKISAGTKNYTPLLKIDFQLKKGIRKTQSMNKAFTALCTSTLQQVNQGYRSIYQRLGKKAVPHVTIYTHHEYPHTSGVKNVYS